MGVITQIRALIDGAHEDEEPIVTAPVAAAQPDLAVASQLTALTEQVAALTTERDQFKAQAEALKEQSEMASADARKAALSAAVRAMGQDGAKAHEATINGWGYAMARDNAAIWNAAADKALDITTTEGAKRVSATPPLPTQDVVAVDANQGPERPKIDAQAYYDALNGATRE